MSVLLFCVFVFLCVWFAGRVTREGSGGVQQAPQVGVEREATTRARQVRHNITFVYSKNVILWIKRTRRMMDVCLCYVFPCNRDAYECARLFSSSTLNCGDVEIRRRFFPDTDKTMDEPAHYFFVVDCPLCCSQDQVRAMLRSRWTSDQPTFKRILSQGFIEPAMFFVIQSRTSYSTMPYSTVPQFSTYITTYTSKSIFSSHDEPLIVLGRSPWPQMISLCLLQCMPLTLNLWIGS